MDSYDQMRRATLAQKEDEEHRKVRTRERYRERLLGNILRHLRTSFVGAIAQIEKSPFGDLFGHGKPPDELTAEELRWRESWKELRKLIFDNGNKQVRAVEKELAEYDVVWNGPNSHISFQVKERPSRERTEEQGRLDDQGQ